MFSVNVDNVHIERYYVNNVYISMNEREKKASCLLCSSDIFMSKWELI